MSSDVETSLSTPPHHTHKRGRRYTNTETTAMEINSPRSHPKHQLEQK